MSWLDTIAFEDAEGKLRKLYDRVTGPDGNVDNIMLAHSLRPHTMEGHMALYKAVLHHYGNQTPKWVLETIGVYVSILNKCAYCVEHHFAGLVRLLKDDAKANMIRSALEAGTLDALDAETAAALVYSEKLTLAPTDLTASDIDAMRNAGYSDGQILEINQVAAYFNYANRTVLGLGVSTEGDVMGLSPGDSDDPSNWNHA